VTDRIPRLVAILALVLVAVYATGTREARSAEEQTWTVNLKDAEIGEFITQVARITGRNFVVDPRVKGRVTVVSSAALDRAGVYDLFLSVLRVHGFAAVPAGEVTKIVQQTLAKQSSSGAETDEGVAGERMLTRVLPATNVQSSELVKILRPLIPQYGHVAAVEDPNVIILSDHADNIRRMEQLIDEIDVADEDEVMMVPLEEAWVGSMVPLLQELAPQQVGPNAQGPQAVHVVANERNNSIVLRGRRSALVDLRGLIRQLDQPATRAGSTRVFYLRHSDAEQIAEILRNMIGDQGDGRGEQQPIAPSFQADVSLNAIVARGEPTTLSEVADLLESLDVRRTQVLIEAAIVEVSLNENEDRGVDFAIADEDGDTAPLAVSPLGGALARLLGRGDDDLIDEQFDPFSAAGGASSPTLAVAKLSNGVSFAAILQALTTTQDSDLLSTPSILTLDNQEASIVVGQNVPFRTGEFTTDTSGSDNPFTTIQREDVGITLRVTPHINEGDSVRLQVEQEVSSVDQSANVGDTAFSDIVTNNRTIQTTILADHEQTIVLGGLIQDDLRRNESRVPFLGSLPVAGRLFRSESTERVKRNLLVFLRPTILRDRNDVADATERKYRSVWGVRPGERAGGKQAEAEPGAGLPPIDQIYEGRPDPGRRAAPSAERSPDSEPDRDAATESREQSR